MSKRQAVEPLEDVLDAPSPGPKRARVEDVDMDEDNPHDLVEQLIKSENMAANPEQGRAL